MRGATLQTRAIPVLAGLLLALAGSAWAGAAIELSLQGDAVHRAPDGHLLVWVTLHNPAAVPTLVEVSAEGSPVVDRLELPGLAHRDLLLFTTLDDGPVEIVARTAGGETSRLPPLPLPPQPAARTCAAVGLGKAALATLPAGWQAAALPALPDEWGPYLAYPLWLVEAREMARATDPQRTAISAAAASGTTILTITTGGAVHIPPIPDPRPLLPEPSDPTPPFPSSLHSTLTRAVVWQAGGALCLAIIALIGVRRRRTWLLAGAVIIAVGAASPLLYPKARVRIAYAPAGDGRLEGALVTVRGGDAGRRVAATGHAWLPLTAAPGLRWVEGEDGLVLEQDGRLAAPATARAVAIARDAAGSPPAHLREIGHGG
jgi:hypothetical protein